MEQNSNRSSIRQISAVSEQHEGLTLPTLIKWYKLLKSLNYSRVSKQKKKSHLLWHCPEYQKLYGWNVLKSDDCFENSRLLCDLLLPSANVRGCGTFMKVLNVADAPSWRMDQWGHVLFFHNHVLLLPVFQEMQINFFFYFLLRCASI